MSRLDHYVLQFLDNPINVLVADLALAALLVVVLFRRQVHFMLKSLMRNWLRTLLTSLATMVLVFVVTMVWSVLWLLDRVTVQKSSNLKVIVTDRWQVPSQLPWEYAGILADGAARKPDDVRPIESMTWQFYLSTIDKEKKTRENMVVFFCMEPNKLLTMMDGLDELTGEQRAQLEEVVQAMNEDPRRILIGKDRLAALNKRVGERISVTGINLSDIDFDGLEILGTFPDGRYDQSAVMNCRLLNDELDAYKIKKGKPHSLSDKRLNLVWLKVPDMKAYERVAEQIESATNLTTPAVKCETLSSGMTAFLENYRDLLWGMRWLLVPAILATMSLVIANAISISVRERRTEMAVLKVLGYGPTYVMMLVLGEALLIGMLSGLLSVAGCFLWINLIQGGIKFPVPFFPPFLIPTAAFWWGPAIGGLTGFLGSIVPALSARSIRVSEVFSRVA